MERIDKLIAVSKNISRADSRALIKRGRVTVDGEIIRDISAKFDEKKNVPTSNNYFFNFLTLEDELIDSTLIDNCEKKYYVQFDDEVKSFGKVNERNDPNGRKGHIQPLIDLELFSNNKEYKL